MIPHFAVYPIARLAARLAHGTGVHVYLSTSCLHAMHDYCKAKEGQAGPKTPATCKFCAAPCVCQCHGGRRK